MAGLLGTLELGQRALLTQQLGVEVAGHNLANVNNPDYARQRLRVQTSPAIPDGNRMLGTGVTATAIGQLRDAFIDRQMVGEQSVTGFLEARQFALQYAQSSLGQAIDRLASGAEGAAAAAGVGGQHGIAENLTELFNAFQSLSTKPADATERMLLLQKGQTLAASFRETSHRLAALADTLSNSLTANVEKVNGLLTNIAGLNREIVRAEHGATGVANDLRDIRQARLEELATLVKIDTATGENGAVNVAISGVTFLEADEVQNALEAYNAGAGRWLLRAQPAGTAITLTSGSLQGTIQTRDEDLVKLQSGVDQLAQLLLREVNEAHRAGYGLNGTTGADFFSGTAAADLQVNAALLADPSKVQAAGVPDAQGDNTVALALAQLAARPQPALGGLTFSQSYGQGVAALGQALADANNQVADQKLVAGMLERQRDAVSGVSLDEEMTELVKYQRAYQASARLITTVDQMFDEVLNLKR